VVGGEADLGIVLGGSGQGEAMAANKVHGARAALCHDELTARLARQHNDANVLSLGGRLVTETVATGIVEAFLTTPFEGGRHLPRLAQLRSIEEQESAR
jgi:ribose 5-phosphate isomerase B